MHRIDGNGHVSNMFTEGSPGVTPATQVTDDWLNDVQEELADFIEAAGITLVKGSSQLLAALVAKLAAYTDAIDVTGPADEVAITVEGTDTGSAIVATGGGSNGANQGAIEAYASSANGSGLLGQGSGSGVGVYAKHSGGTDKTAVFVEGYVSLNGATEPAASANVGGNRITPMNIAKSWARLGFDGAGAVSVASGFNATASLVTLGGGQKGFRVTFPKTFDAGTYLAIARTQMGSTGSTAGFVLRENSTTGYYEAAIYDDAAGTSIYDPNTDGRQVTCHILFFGAN